MPKTIDNILDEYSIKQGWNLPTQLVLLIRFLDEKGLHGDLEEFLKETMEEENHASKLYNY